MNIHTLDDLTLDKKRVASLVVQPAGDDVGLYASMAQKQKRCQRAMYWSVSGLDKSSG